MTLLGSLALWVAFLIGLWGGLTGFLGGARARGDLIASSRHAVYAMFGSLVVAVVALEVALFRHDFNVEYVASYTSRNLPVFYTWSALY
ncbi:MAG: heme lyase CcmF/NrfE family subunit, partial [Gemmatimonadales bacterium]